MTLPASAMGRHEEPQNTFAFANVSGELQFPPGQRRLLTALSTNS